MRKLTKTVNRRRKNYKPTVGVTGKSGKRYSINGTKYYIFLENKRKREAEIEARKFMENFIAEKCPQFAKIVDFLKAMGGMMYY